MAVTRNSIGIPIPYIGDANSIGAMFVTLNTSDSEQFFITSVYDALSFDDISLDRVALSCDADNEFIIDGSDDDDSPTTIPDSKLSSVLSSSSSVPLSTSV